MLYPTELQARQALTIHQTVARVHRASYGLVRGAGEGVPDPHRKDS